MRRYWINTDGEDVIAISLVNIPLDHVVTPETRMQLKIQQCTDFEYYTFSLFRINLKAKDKYKWLKSFIKMKLVSYIKAILSVFSKNSPKNQ